jgi:phage recombination protein Bet
MRKEKIMSETQEIQKPDTNLPALRPPRLPYHPLIKEEFGYDIHAWKALVEAIFPNAKTPESVRLALSYCKARKLDPFKRCIHIVPIWDSNKRQEVETIWPGIGELRTTAHRTGAYAGRDKTEFGPMVEETWGGGNDKVTVKFPEWAQVTVYRMVGKIRVAYAGPQVYWMETFSSVKSGVPNSMWRTRPRGQLDKCAEAAALRAAFPEEVGNEYIDAEAHPGNTQRQSFEETQANTTRQIEAEQGTEPIDTTFEGNGDNELENEPNDPQTKAKAEEQKQALAESEASGGKKKTTKNAARSKNQPKPYHCNHCNRDLEAEEILEDGQGLQCPKCLSRKIVRNPNAKVPDAIKD